MRIEVDLQVRVVNGEDSDALEMKCIYDPKIQHPLWRDFEIRKAVSMTTEAMLTEKAGEESA